MTHDVDAHATPLHGPADLDPLLAHIGDARIVQLGEASHGTHDFYRWRAEISRRLIAEHGFSFVAVEGDWPDCRALDRCVRHVPGAPEEPWRVLDGFERWPTWMWANTDVVDFATWLRDHNAALPARDRVGFHGLDVYSLWDSLRAIMDYLADRAPEHLEVARRAWRCFEPYGEDPHEYAWATRLVPASCEPEVTALLADIVGRTVDGQDGADADAGFAAAQNAAVVSEAERYYRTVVRGGAASWNVRDHHMADTLDRLLAHHGPDAKGIVWAHNTHVGDARATDMARNGMVNLGQLARERHGADTVALVGFAAHRGQVVAGDGWGAPMRVLDVPPARDGSLEALLHEAGCGPSVFLLGDDARPEWATRRLPHRAIGVVYDPAMERYGNYVPTVAADRYDALCWFEDTEALRPLHLEPAAIGEEQETYPWGR